LTKKEFKKKLSEENNSPGFEKIKKEIVKFLQQVPAITQEYIIRFFNFGLSYLVYSQNSSNFVLLMIASLATSQK
jgi:hypothetical protein